ncbi:hypothetical protein SAY86_022857 [Trapa natans]|nr:hypothetical protein SAY86_022857 [Trapa natans]
MKSTQRANSPKLELSLNISPPPSSSPDSSLFLSCGLKEATTTNSFRYSSRPEAEATSSAMVLVGCPRCLMYVMLSGAKPKCPRCKSTVLLGFLGGDEHRSAEKLIMN